MKLVKTEWPYGLWCTGCGRRILFGHEYDFVSRGTYSEAYCNTCLTGEETR